MHFEYNKKSRDALFEAKKSNFFSLMGLSDEGILARYYLCLSFERLIGFIPVLEKDIKGKPGAIYGKNGECFYWSIAHTENYVASMFGEYTCGIDIAEYDERDISLLSSHKETEYSLLGSRNWKNFYLLWTAKEALIKKCGTSLEDMARIHLISKNETGYSFEFAHKTHTIYTKFDLPIIISYTI